MTDEIPLPPRRRYAINNSAARLYLPTDVNVKRSTVDETVFKDVTEWFIWL